MLPAPRSPFPVKYPYFVRSDMYKTNKPLYGFDEDALFLVDSDYETVFWTCLEVLQQHPKHARAYLTDDLDNLTKCLWQIAELVSVEMPNQAAFTDGVYKSHLLGISLNRSGEVAFNVGEAIFPEAGAACYQHLQALSPFDKLCDLLRLSVQEDLAIGRVNSEDNSDVMECLLVSIPSRWDPDEKIGLSLAGIHASIPNSERLVKASPNLVNAIMTKGDFVRYNWTLSLNRWCRNSTLERNHREEYAEMNALNDFDAVMRAIYLRTERQTFRAFPDLNRYLFIIHTYLHPLSTVLNTQARKEHLYKVLASMKEDVRRERGLSSVACRYLSEHLM